MTEAHSVDNYNPTGKGSLYIADYSATNPPTDPDDYIRIGNCPAFSLEPVVERKPHYSSESSSKTRDLNPVVSKEYNFSFDCDEQSAKNMARFFLGTLTQSTRRIAGLQNVDKEYVLKFVSNNEFGPNQIVYLHRATIGPNGPLQFIGDDYIVQSYSGEGLSDTDNHPSSPYFDIKMITTTTTSTTTTSSSTTTTTV